MKKFFASTSIMAAKSSSVMSQKMIITEFLITSTYSLTRHSNNKSYVLRSKARPFEIVIILKQINKIIFFSRFFNSSNSSNSVFWHLINQITSLV
jgi:hypothetical protein